MRAVFARLCIPKFFTSSFSDHDMEIVPNSSGEGSPCDEEMSQEIPLQTGSYYSKN
jgi:hypothetical protein